MHISKLYKTILLIAIVVGPIYWLMVTEDGKRRTDTLMLWITGGDPIDIKLEALDATYRVEDWKQVYPDIDWDCQAQQTSFGDFLCYSEISAYNGIPARYLTVFFRDGHSSGLKLVYRNPYHSQLGGELQRQLGAPRIIKSASEDAPDADNVLLWHTGYGQVMLKQELLSGEEEAALLWLPAAATESPPVRQ